MSWKDVDDKVKKKIDGNFVSCSETWELNYILKKVLEKYPNKTKKEVERNIQKCCGAIKGNRPRSAFMECLRKGLDL